MCTGTQGCKTHFTLTFSTIGRALAHSVYPGRFSACCGDWGTSCHLPQRHHLEGHHLEGHHLGHVVDALHLLHHRHHSHPAGHHLPPPPQANSGASCLTCLRGGLGTEQHNGTLILLASAGHLKLFRSSRSGLVAPFLQIVQVRVIEEAQLSLQGDQSASSQANIIGDLPASSTPATANITKKILNCASSLALMIKAYAFT